MFAISEMRVRAGMTQQNVADALGVTRSRYASWEREDRDINLDDAIRLADLFGCTLSELAGQKPPSVELTSDERHLVDSYRSTDARGKAAIAAIAESQRE